MFTGFNFFIFYGESSVPNQTNKFISLFALMLLAFSSASHAQKAPSFTLDGDKGKISLSSYKNQIVYVDFWASWCKPCRKSFSFMNDMETRYAKKGLKIIAVNLDSDRSDAKSFLQKNPAKFTIAYDPDGVTPGKYKLQVMPTSYLIDRKGNLLKVHKGFKNSQKADLEKMIVQALNKK